MIIFNVKALINSIAASGLKLLLAAGIIYTIGTIFYGIGRDKRYFHSIFHFFVLAASILFFFSIYLYVM